MFCDPNAFVHFSKLKGQNAISYRKSEPRKTRESKYTSIGMWVVFAALSSTCHASSYSAEALTTHYRSVLGPASGKLHFAHKVVRDGAKIDRGSMGNTASKEDPKMGPWLYLPALVSPVYKSLLVTPTHGKRRKQLGTSCWV